MRSQGVTLYKGMNAFYKVQSVRFEVDINDIMSFEVTSQAGIEKRKFHIRDWISNTCTILLLFGNPARAQYTIAKMKM